ncbi:MAG: alpha-ketoacid dehydrogenase subunit beta [Deltaproteobacteria bacterium]|nr:alpha-ketoacid dehydrogenase subunit beta [Deltaproteobacteria bacterium]MBW2362501.1 alpha-ketoacid dehydrogenase subunit beta [Deltaproteobacteria bacterium]
MGRDASVILIGEDIHGLTLGPYAEFGPERLWSAPISESGFTGMAVGAALTGLRPIVDLLISSLLYVAMDPLVNQAGKLRAMTGGQAKVPAVFRCGLWHGSSYAAQHSDRPYPLFMNSPGLKVAIPATPADAKGLLQTAVRDDDPVMIFEDRNLAHERGPVCEGDAPVPFGQARVHREGSDVTLVAIASAVREALAAADDLAREGISVEVIDPRTLVPLDRETLLGSVRRTGRLVVADPAHRTCGAAAEIAALAAEEAFDALRAPVARVTTPDVPIPFSPALESKLYPSQQGIADAVRRVARY